MALNSIKRKPNTGRDIKYLNKDFENFRQNLIQYAKTYFPTSYSDFNESSPGMMFIEMMHLILEMYFHIIQMIHLKNR